MFSHLEYVPPVRSEVKQYAFRMLDCGPSHDYGAEFVRRRTLMKDMGHFIAEMGLHKQRVKDPNGTVARVMELYRTYEANPMNQAGCATMSELLSIIMGNEFIRDFNRDNQKLVSCAWSAVPWHTAKWFMKSPLFYTHSLHMAVNTEGMVAFADNPAKRTAEKYTTMKPGRYLQRFFGDQLTEADIKEWSERSAISNSDLQLHFIEHNDPEGWVRVYREGPASCMQGEDCVRVYAHEKSVLRLAYVTWGDDIVGRAIVREDEKKYIRVYPNTDSAEAQRIHTWMKNKLVQMGYGPGNLFDVKLAKIPRNKYSAEYVMPYLDFGTSDSPPYVEDCGSYFCVTDGDGVEAQNTNGYIDLNGHSCDDCGDSVNEDDVSYIEHCDRHVCDSCLSNNYTYAMGRRYEEYFPSDEVVYCETDGNYYHTEYLSRHDVYECNISSNYYKLDDMVEVDGSMVHNEYATALDEPHGHDDYALTDDVVETHDGRKIHNEDAVEHTDGLVYHMNDDLPEDEETNEEMENA